MKYLISYLLLYCTFLPQISIATQYKENITDSNINNINMQASYETKQLQLIESNLDDENLTVYKEQNNNLDNFLSELSKDKKFLMIRDINNEILNADEDTIYSRFKINPYTLSKYKEYWNKLKLYIGNIKNEVKNKDEISLNILLMSGNILLSKSDILNEIKHNSTIIQDDERYYLKHKRKRSIINIINSEKNLKENNIFSGIYTISKTMYDAILKWQDSYIDAFAENNNSQNQLNNCRKQLDKIFEIFNITD